MEKTIDNHFHEEEPQNYNFLRFITMSQQDSYLDQFLTSNKSQEKIVKQTLDSQIKLEVEQNSIDNSESTPKTQISNSRNRKCPNSLFHNFQKYLIKTIQTVCDFHQLDFQRYEESKLAYKIWKKFKNIKIYTKQLLQFVFGVQQQMGANLLLQNKYIEKLGFLNIYIEQSQAQIIYAQKILRLMVIQKLQKASQTKIFKTIKLKEKQAFLMYLRMFTQELSEGGVERRISQNRKKKFLHNSAVSRQLV